MIGLIDLNIKVSNLNGCKELSIRITASIIKKNQCEMTHISYS